MSVCVFAGWCIFTLSLVFHSSEVAVNGVDAFTAVIVLIIIVIIMFLIIITLLPLTTITTTILTPAITLKDVNEE